MGETGNERRCEGRGGEAVKREECIWGLPVFGLAATLGVQRYAAVGIIRCMWMMATDIHKFDAAQACFEMGYKDDPETLFAALIKHGIVRFSTEGYFELTEWMFLYVAHDRSERDWAAGGRITDKMRAKVYARDRHRCRNCKSRLDLTVDHVVPVSRGGRMVFGNLVTLCRPCNSRKGNR